MILRRGGSVSGARNARTARMEKKRTGRPSKGPRKRVHVRLPLDLVAALEEKAAEAGMSLTDYLGELAAERTGVPYQAQGALMAS